MLSAAAMDSVCGGEVTYDGRSLIINGQRNILFSGSIHYPRSTPEVLLLFILYYLPKKKIIYSVYMK